ncbi:MAG: hypothetical protein IMF09_12380 [Proteobacteria bacterium]|nr:hypothetical protein [Pseudomonadota bacterium]
MKTISKHRQFLNRTILSSMLLTSLLIINPALAASKVKLDTQPSLIALSGQKLDTSEYKQVGVGFEEALLDSQYITINVDALSIIKGVNEEDAINSNNKNQGLDIVNMKNAQMSGQDILIHLPGITDPVFLAVEIVQNPIKNEDVVSYSGHVVGSEHSFFSLSLSANGVIGKINYGKHIYLITATDDTSSRFIISKLDKSMMNADTGEDVIVSDQASEVSMQTTEASKSGKSTVQAQSAGQGTGRVDILFYYASDVSNPSLIVSQTVTEMNAALARSLVPTSKWVTSVGVTGVSTTFSGLCKTPILVNNMAAKVGVFANIDTEMDLAGADLAFLLVGDNSASGCFPGQPGRVGGIAYLYSSTSPFGLSAAGYAIADITALHEIGHMLGGSHSDTANTTNGTTVFARGMTETTVPWQTIMGSYDTAPCYFYGLPSNCERIDYFTSPQLTYNGVQLGAYGPNGRNMKKWLYETAMTAVSSYNDDPLPPPAAPNPIAVAYDPCYGYNDVNWTAQTSATDYKLYMSTSSSFTSPTLVYSGTNTYTTVNVNPGSTWYLKATACNAAGCGAYSTQVTANYYNICP